MVIVFVLPIIRIPILIRNISKTILFRCSSPKIRVNLLLLLLFGVCQRCANKMVFNMFTGLLIMWSVCVSVCVCVRSLQFGWMKSSLDTLADGGAEQNIRVRIRARLTMWKKKFSKSKKEKPKRDENGSIQRYIYQCKVHRQSHWTRECNNRTMGLFGWCGSESLDIANMCEIDAINIGATTVACILYIIGITYLLISSKQRSFTLLFILFESYGIRQLHWLSRFYAFWSSSSHNHHWHPYNSFDSFE